MIPNLIQGNTFVAVLDFAVQVVCFGALSISGSCVLKTPVLLPVVSLIKTRIRLILNNVLLKIPVLRTRKHLLILNKFNKIGNGNELQTDGAIVECHLHSYIMQQNLNWVRIGKKIFNSVGFRYIHCS